MNKTILQNELNKRNINVKILLVEKTEFNDYEIIFTRDLSYKTEIESVKESITEPEEDVLAEDLEDAIFEIERTLAKEPWYKKKLLTSKLKYIFIKK